jgi:DHA2 family multidrug resistance protein
VVAPALGPILGGWLVDNDLWRWIFFINVPIGVVGVSIAARVLRELRHHMPPPLDVLGLVTEVIGFGAVLYAASIAADRGWTSPAVLFWFGLGFAGLLWFAFIELYVARSPLLDLRLFRNRTFLLASLVGYVSVIALFGAEFLLPVYLQALRGRTALETGFILLPLAFAAGLFMPLAGKLYDRIGPRPLVTLGFGVLLLNTWQLSLIEADTPISWILVLLALRGVALGLTVQTTFVTALSVVPLPAVTRGSSLVNATRQVVQSIGVALLATVLASTLSQPVRAMQRRMEALPPTEQAAPVGLCEPSTYPAAAPPPAIQLLERACDESVAGFERAYRLTSYAALLALALGLLLPGWPFAWAGRRAADASPAPAH